MDKVADYVKVFSHRVSEDLRLATLHSLTEKTFIQHTFDDYQGTSIPRSGEKELESYYDTVATDAALKEVVWGCIRDYLLFVNETEVFAGWNGFSPLKFNRYKPGMVMSEHVDHIYSIFDGERRGIPILTCLGLLNDSFTGGKLIIRGNTEVNLSAGDVVIFPSNFMYKHKVAEVKSGERYSFVTWVY